MSTGLLQKKNTDPTSIMFHFRSIRVPPRRREKPQSPSWQKPPGRPRQSQRVDGLRDLGCPDAPFTLPVRVPGSTGFSGPGSYLYRRVDESLSGTSSASCPKRYLAFLHPESLPWQHMAPAHGSQASAKLQSVVLSPLSQDSGYLPRSLSQHTGQSTA